MMASLLFISLLIPVSHAFFIPIIIVRSDGETDVFATGILEYTILTGAANLRTETLDILCINIAYGNNTSVVLERKGENPQVRTMSMGTITARLDRNCTAESCEGNYTCSVNISQKTEHGVAYTYTMKRTFQIRQVSVIACKSRVGTTVILQERLSFVCIGNNIFWNRNNMTTTFFTISQTKRDFSCGKYENSTWVETCASEIIVRRTLEIEILPKYFTSFTPLLQFDCSSYPPRLMYWAVYSTNGNILDTGNQNQSILVNTTISIDQSIGFTSISITEDIPGGNDIQEVICLTYGTQMAVAIAHLVTDDIPPVTDNFHKSTTTDNLTIPEQSRTTVPASIPYIVVITVLSVIIAIVVTFALYKIFKSRNASSKSADVDKNVTPAETEMQDNIIYQSAETPN